MTTEIKRADFANWLLERVPVEHREHVAATLKAECAKSEEQRRADREKIERSDAGRQLQGFKQQARFNCGLRGEQWRNTFKTWKHAGDTLQRQSQASALRVAAAFAEAFPDLTRGVAFVGNPGIGKDHLLHSIVNVILDKLAVFDVRYFYSLDIERAMFREWEQHSDPETRTEEIIRGCDLLLIGDLHKVLGVKSEQVRNAVLRTINQAEGTGRPIICITSNIPLADYDGEYGTAIGSRLSKIMEWHEITGPDRRRQ